MKRKVIKYLFVFVLLAFVAYNSVYFQRLDARSTGASDTFNAATYARNFYENELFQRLDSAANLPDLLALLKSDPDQAFAKHSHALAIGNIGNFLVKGEGIITTITEHQIYIVLENDPQKNKVPIASEFIYGNTIRDASGLINLNDFTNTSEVNKISEEINAIVRKEVLKPFLATVKTGDRVQFKGAVEMNRANIDFSATEIIPVQLSIINE